MPFPRPVIFEACSFLGSAVNYHGEFEDMVLGWELDQLEDRNGLAIHQRFRNLFRYLRDNPETRYDGRLLTDLVVELPLGECRRTTKARHSSAPWNVRDT